MCLICGNCKGKYYNCENRWKKCENCGYAAHEDTFVTFHVNVMIKDLNVGYVIK